MSGTFDDAMLRLVDAGLPEDGTTTALLAAVAPALSKTHPPELDSYGLTTRDRLTARSGHPLRVLVDALSTVFQVPEVDLYVHQAHAGAVEVEFGEPPLVMVPAHVMSLTETQQAFLLARALLDIARGLHAVDKLPPHAIELVLVAATRNVDPTFGAGQGDEDYLNQQAKRLYKALPRRCRKPLEDAAAAYGPAPRPPIQQWTQRVRMTANRAALLVADDPFGCIDLLRKTEGDLARLQGSALEEGMARVTDAMRFVASDTAMTARKRL